MGQSHPDTDARTGAEILRSLTERAGQMMVQGESKITAGRPGEDVVAEEVVGMFTITQRPSDPDCLRVSIGESAKIEGSAYLVFRGEPGEVLQVMERATAALRASHFRW